MHRVAIDVQLVRTIIRLSERLHDAKSIAIATVNGLKVDPSS